MPAVLPSGRIRNGSRQAHHSPNLARREGGDQGCPADDRQAAAQGFPLPPFQLGGVNHQNM
jgi:hypothetical protein